MSYGAPSAGYGQPDLQLGMPVSSDNGWTGAITEIIPAAPGYEGAVRVAWHGDGTTLVARSMFVVENGQAVIRTQPPPPPVVAPPAPPAPPVVAQPQLSEDDLVTRLAAPPAQNDPSHVNPFVNDPPLVTPEPPPIHPTHGGQVRDEGDDVTYIPPVHREPLAVNADATVLPSATHDFIPPQPPPAATDDPGATYIPPVPREPLPTGATMPLDATHDAGTHVMAADQQEVTIPVIEEQVAAHPEWRDAGSIVVRTVAEEIPQTLTQETQREELFVERVAVGRALADGEEVLPREEGDTHIIPVIVEEAVVVTRRVLAEELRITKRIIPTMQTVHTMIRKERVEIDAGHLADRVHDGDSAADASALPPAIRPGDPS